MALGLNFGTGAAGDGDSLLTAFTSINNMFSTTTKISGGDLTINDVRVGKGANNIGSNTALGNNALASNISGLNNTAVGLSALAANTNGGYNTAVGLSALAANTSGIANTSLGSDSLFSNISGNGNTAIGKGALQNNTSSDNTAVGSNTLFSNTIGTLNTAIGNSALLNNTQGTHNSAFGYASLLNNTIGINNTGIGREALNGNSSFNNCTGLGYNAQVTASDQVQLGDSATTTYVYGTVQNRSDIRDKAEVRDTVLGLDFINELRAVDYKWDIREDYKTEMPTQGELSDEDFKIVMDEWLESVKLDNITHDGTHTRTRYHHGLIAQEVQDVIEASGVDFGGFQDHSVNGGQDVLSIGYTELIAPMIKAIQELTARINVLEGN